MPVVRANRLDAHQLMEDGLTALSDVEMRGIRVDAQYCRGRLDDLQRDIQVKSAELMQHPEVQKWRRIEGARFKLGSAEQLARYLYKHLGYKPVAMTEGGDQGSTTADSLDQLGIPWVSDLVQIKVLNKLATTYLEGLLEEEVGGRIYPSFNLSTVITYRSSCTDPNAQNVPKRIPWVAEIIRGSIIPSPGFRILEIDFSGLEVRASACYHHDPSMITYIEDSTRDMHRDMACECFLLTEAQVSDPIRDSTKSDYVFAEFYGSYWRQVSARLWRDITKYKLALRDGTPLMDHLTAKGIGVFQCPECEAVEKAREKGRGSVGRLPRRSSTPCCFENHIRLVEERFWGQRFAVYAGGRRRQYSDYQRRGYFDTLTGFRCGGVMGRNDSFNYPIQGSAFHILLWSLIRLHNWAKARGLKSGIVGQIHDSLLWEIWPSELWDVVAEAEQIMCRDVRAHWPWICVPSEFKMGISPVDGSWHETKKLKMPK